jgi:hypothetical protein
VLRRNQWMILHAHSQPALHASVLHMHSAMLLLRLPLPLTDDFARLLAVGGTVTHLCGSTAQHGKASGIRHQASEW